MSGWIDKANVTGKYWIWALPACMSRTRVILLQALASNLIEKRHRLMRTTRLPFGHIQPTEEGRHDNRSMQL